LLKEAGCEWAVSTSQSTVIYDYDLRLQAVVSLMDLLCKCLRLTAMVKCVTDVQRLSVWLYEHDAEAVMVRELGQGAFRKSFASNPHLFTSRHTGTLQGCDMPSVKSAGGIQ
jgi:hypothetical protein